MIKKKNSLQRKINSQVDARAKRLNDILETVVSGAEV
jgi:hypothetical protein